MRRALTIMLACGALAACELPNPWQYKVPNLAAVSPPGDLAADRAACDKQYPQAAGSYAAHAECMNTAVEKDAIPFARYPELLRMGEQLRLKYSTAIDRGALSPAEGARKIREADELVAAAINDRDVGRETVAAHRVAALEAMLQ